MLNIFKRKNKCEYDRDYMQKQAKKFLKKKNYTFVKEIGSGGFGTVIAIQRKSDSKIIAAKVQHKTYTSPGELYLWPCLRHPNVLPLLDTMHYKNMDIFLMPLLSDCLYNVLSNPDFRNSPKLFEMTIIWMKDLMTALEYMHGYGACHLDVKPDNILITSDLRAVICDFSGIAETKAPVNK